jgi:hypothetical protein
VVDSGVAPFELLVFTVTLCRHRNRDFYHGLLKELAMSGRLDSYYLARHENLNGDGRWGFGVIFLKDGKVYGGDSLSAFMGEFEDGVNIMTARVKGFPLAGAYHSVTDYDDKPWALPDIRGGRG